MQPDLPFIAPRPAPIAAAGRRFRVAVPGPRQSAAQAGKAVDAQDIARGAIRLLDALGYRTLTEMRLVSGRRVDVIGLDRRGRFAVVEVKSSLADLAADKKWQDYLPYCDDFYFAVASKFPLDRLPDETGIMIADRFAGEIVRCSLRQTMNGAARRRQILQFALTAGSRLYQQDETDI